MTENPNYPPVNELLDSVNKKLDSLDEDVNRIDRDLANDRKDIENLKTEMSTLNRKMDGIMEVLTRFQVKTKDAVKDAVSEANAPMAKQMKQFVNKKVLRVHVKPSGIWSRTVEWWRKINE